MEESPGLLASRTFPRGFTAGGAVWCRGKLALQILGSIAMAVFIGALWTRLLPHLSIYRIVPGEVGCGAGQPMVVEGF